MNFINSWKKGNKKNKIDISLRIGFFTLLEIIICAESKCEEDCKCPKNPYHEKNGCEKKKAEIIANETQENCSQGKTKNI